MEKVGREVKESKKEGIGNRERVKKKVWAGKGIGSERRKGKIPLYIQNIIKWISERQQKKDIGRYEEIGIHKGRESASFNVEKEENEIEEMGRYVNKKA